MSEQEPLHGQCLCGAVTLSVTNPVGWLGACHCAMCQRWNGGVFLCFPAKDGSVEVTGPVQQYASSPLADRAFCGSCGTHLWMRDKQDGASFDMMPGPFEATRDWPLKSEIYHDKAMAALKLSGDHRRATAAAYRAKHPEIEGVE